MPLIALTAKGDGIKIPTIWPPRTLPQTPSQNGDNPPVWVERCVEVKDADINPWPERTNCYEVVFALESKVANTNVWVDFTAYTIDNRPLYVGDSISFDGCKTYTNEIVVAVDGEGKSGQITFVWDAGRCGAAGSVHHAIIDAWLPGELWIVEPARIDEDRIGAVTLTASGLAVETKSYVKATVSGLPSGLRFDKKTLAITGAAKKDETKTVKVTVKNASGYTFKQSFSVTVAGGAVTSIVPADDQVRTGAPVVLVCDPELGKVKGSKVMVAGKKASIRATPAKGAIFLGWYEDAAFANAATNLPKGYLTASQSVVVPPEGLILYARFVELEGWAVGTFDGVCYEVVEGTNAVESGTVTFTVSTKGRVSGKTKTGGKTYSFSAKTLDDAVETEDAGLVFVAHPMMRVGKEVKPLTLRVFENTAAGLGAAEILYGEEANAPFALSVQNGWKLKPAVLPAFPTGKDALMCEAPMGIGLTLKFGAKGKVTVFGTVPGDDLSPVKASAKAQVLPVSRTGCLGCGESSGCLAQTCVYVAPKKNLETGFCRVYDLMLEAEESGTKIESVKILSPEEYADYSFTGYVRCIPGRPCPR